MCIKEITYPQYIFLLNKNWHTALADFYIKSLLSGRGKAYVLYDEDIIVSYCIIVKDGNRMSLEYIYTGEEYRGKGYATELLRQIIEIEKGGKYRSKKFVMKLVKGIEIKSVMNVSLKLIPS